jgi:nucleoside-diphosphate-sugar epimerase
MKRILITGNMGYVGPLVVKHLRATRPASKLIGLDTAYFGSCLSGGIVLPESDLDEQVFSDVRSVPEAALEDIGGVVHLAGISNDPIGNAYEEVTFEVNHRATVELARQAKAAGARSFVFASSCSVYGYAEEAPRHEDSPLDPLTAYAKSKIMAEQDLAELADSSFAVTCLRFATACGFSPRIRLDLVLNDFVARASTTGRIQILSDGTPWRPLIEVRDMALAIDWALGRDSSTPCPFLVVNTGSDGWNYRVRELAEAVAAQIPGSSIDVNRAAQPDKRSYRVSFRKFRELAPGHQPRYDVARAIEDLICGFMDTDFQNQPDPFSKYSRLKYISLLSNQGRIDHNLRWHHRTRQGGRSTA